MGAAILACCLVINEIAHAPSDARAEFVELYNAGSEAVDLSGFSIQDARNVPAALANRPLMLPPGHYVVLVRDGVAFSNAFPGVAYIPVSPWPSLNNGGDRVSLSLDGSEVEFVPYSGDWGVPERSLERIDPSGPAWHPVNWTASPDPSGATPGRRNAAYNPDREPPQIVLADRLHPDTVFVRFSEPVVPAARFQAAGSVRWAEQSASIIGLESDVVSVSGLTDLFGNTATPSSRPILPPPRAAGILISEQYRGHPPYAELFNPGPDAVSLRRSVLGDRFPPLSLAAGSTLVLTPDPAALRAAFPGDWAALRVSRDVLSPDTLGLTGPDGATVDVAVYDERWLDPAAPSVTALERLGGSGLHPSDWASVTPSPGNHSTRPLGPAPEPGDVAISEVLFHAGAAGFEFVEIAARRGVDLFGTWLRIHRPPGEPDSVRLAYAPLALESGGLVVAVLPMTGVAVTDLVRVASSRVPWATPATHWRPLAGAGALRNSGFDLELADSGGTPLDRAAAGPEEHHPALAETAGISLERVSLSGSGTDAGNWRSATDAYGSTPGQVRTRETAPSEGSWVELSSGAFDPAESALVIRVAAPYGETVRVDVFARDGRPVRHLAALGSPVGELYWHGRNEAGRTVQTGVYVLLVRTSGGRSTRRVVVVARR